MWITIKEILRKLTWKKKNAIIYVITTRHQPRLKKIISNFITLSGLSQRCLNLTKRITKKAERIQERKGNIITIQIILIAWRHLQKGNLPTIRQHRATKDNNRPYRGRSSPIDLDASTILRPIQHNRNVDKQVSWVEQLPNGQELTHFRWWEKSHLTRIRKSTINLITSCGNETTTRNVKKC